MKHLIVAMMLIGGGALSLSACTGSGPTYAAQAGDTPMSSGVSPCGPVVSCPGQYSPPVSVPATGQ